MAHYLKKVHTISAMTSLLDYLREQGQLIPEVYQATLIVSQN